MFFVLLLAAITVNASIPNLDYDTKVIIRPGQKQAMQISSNPTTGYWWILSKTHSSKLTVKNYSGEYTAYPHEPGLCGSGGVQTFEIACSDSCIEGEKFSLIFSLKRSWEPTPIDEKKIEVIVSNDPKTQ